MFVAQNSEKEKAAADPIPVIWRPLDGALVTAIRRMLERQIYQALEFSHLQLSSPIII